MLIGHWKLDGNALDSSGYGNDGTLVGGPVWTAGPTGGALEFDGTNWAEVGSALEFNSTEISVSIWVFMNSGAPTDIGIIGGGQDSDNRIHWERPPLGGNMRLRIGAFNNTDLPLHPFNEWVHLAFTYNRNTEQLKYYSNGIEAATRSGDSGSNVYFSELEGMSLIIGASLETSGRRWHGKLADLRIYNHALSARDVSILSNARPLSVQEENYINKELKLHYGFDDFQEPTENITNSVDDGVNLWNGTDNTWQFEENDYLFGSKCVRHIKGTGAPGWAMLAHNSRIPASGKPLNTTYTMSFWAKPISNVDSIRIRCELRTATEGTDRYSAIDIVISNVLNGWNRYEASGYFPSHRSTTGDPIVDIYPIFGINGVVSATAELLVDGLQLEAKEYATPFVDGSRDGTVIDYSGQDNHAPLALATTPQWTSDSRIGKGAYKFDGTQHIDTGFHFSSLLSMSISLWFYGTDFSADFTGLIGDWWYNLNTGGARNIGILSDKTIYVNVSKDGVSWDTITTAVLENTWYHLVVTMDSNKVVKVYLNGILSQIGSHDVSSFSPQETVWVGRWKGGAGATPNRPFYGLIDDVQIYSTALSADDIQTLYQTRASIDDVGNLWVRGVKESFDLQKGLVGYWKLDGDAIDSSVYQNDGIVYGATSVSGVIGQAYSFNGTSDYIGIPDSSEFDVQNLTIAAWVNFADNSQSFIFEKGNVNTQYSLFSHGSDIVFRTKPVGEAYQTLNPTKVAAGIVNGTWHHIVGTYDGSYKKIYVDGVEKASVAWSKTLEYNANGSSIGRFGGTTTGYYFTGDIDDVRIYNVALTEPAIKALHDLTFLTLNTPMSITKQGVTELYSINEVGPIEGIAGYWPLDGHAEDYGGSGNDGAIDFNYVTHTSGINETSLETDDSLIRDKISAMPLDTSNPIFYNSGPMTIMFWVNISNLNPPNGDGSIFILCRYVWRFILSGTDFVFSTGRLDDGDCSAIQITGGTAAVSSSGVNLQQDTWYHMGAVYSPDCVNGNGYLELFLNGESVGYSTSLGYRQMGTNYGAVGHPHSYIRWGTTNHGTWKPTPAKYADTRIYNRVLPVKEIKILYDLTAGTQRAKMTNNTLYVKNQLIEN